MNSKKTLNERLATLKIAFSVILLGVVLVPSDRVQADVFQFEEFTGFPDDNHDGLEDWTFDGWFESSHIGDISNGSPFSDWEIEFTSPHSNYSYFQFTPDNSSVSYGESAGGNFNISDGLLTKPIGSEDIILFSYDGPTPASAHDNIIQVRFGGDSDLLLQARTNFNFATNVRVTRDPATPIFARSVPEPSFGGILALTALLICGRRRRNKIGS